MKPKKTSIESLNLDRIRAAETLKIVELLSREM